MTEAGDRPEPFPPTEPVKKAPFLPGKNLTIRRMGGLDGSEMTVYVFRDVLEELIFAASFRPAQTSTGILTGGFYEGPTGRYVELRGFQDTRVVDNTLELTQRLRSEWRELWRDKELLEAGLLPLGWFVSRPGSSGRPGPFDMITHLSFFNRSYHVFCVLDPLEQLLGFYRQVADAELANVAFNLIESTPNPKEQIDANQ